MKIGLPDDYAGVLQTLSCLPKVAGHDVVIWNDVVRDIDVLAERFRDVDALVLLRERTQLGGSLIRRLPNLKLITINGPHPNIDVEACTANGTLICAGRGRTSHATAELTWGLILAAMRQIPQQMQRLQRGAWQSALGTSLRGRTLGVVGFGKIGTIVASYGRAFGMNVLVWSRARGLAEASKAGFDTCSDRAELFAKADIVTLHTRYAPETYGLITSEHLARMKPTSLIVNTSRSGLIASGALLTALRRGRPGLAAIDVFDTEPPGADDSLLHLDNVICTPHLGYFERDQIETYYSDQFERVLAYTRGEPIDMENPEALRRRSDTRA